MTSVCQFLSRRVFLMHLFVPLKFSVTCFLRLTTFIPSKVIYDFILRRGLHLFFVFCFNIPLIHLYNHKS